MRIAHYYTNGTIECGALDDRGRVRAFSSCHELAGIPSRDRLNALLTMAPDERDAVNQRVLADGPVVVENPDILAPAVPYPPLYIYNHGNSPTIYKRQIGGRKQWEMTRIPHFRTRPWSSLSGHGETIPIRRGCGLSFGLELGIVIGRRAFRVDREHAAEHIAGVVGLNDGFMGGVFSNYNTNTPSASAPCTRVRMIS